MSSGTIITDYLGRGTAAARPVTPPVPTGGTSFYYATDTLEISVWNGAAWVKFFGTAALASTLIDLLGSTQGNILYRGASAWTVLAPGAINNVLISGGAAANPSWVASYAGVVYDWDIENGQLSSISVHPSDGRSITGLYNGGGYGSIRSFSSHAAASGKFYFEFLVGIVGNHSPFVGVGSSSADLASFVGHDVEGWSIGCASFSWHNNSSTVQNSYAAGDIIGVAVDFTATTGSIKFFKNNVAQSNLYGSLTLGTMFAMVGMGNGISFNSRGKICLRASEQTYSPPAGYSAWI
jgi:hypothetical protein